MVILATNEEVLKNIPSDALYYNGHYYKIYSSSWDWEKDKAFCESLGGHLVTITDPDEKLKVEYLIGLYEKLLNATLLQLTSAVNKK